MHVNVLDTVIINTLAREERSDIGSERSMLQRANPNLTVRSVGRPKLVRDQSRLGAYINLEQDQLPLGIPPL